MNAVAGSGKTTSILKAMDHVRPGSRILFLAFNSHIKKELESRAPKHVKVQTCHGYGYAAIMKGVDPKPKMDEDKLNYLIDDLIPQEHVRIQRRGALRRLVSLAKSYVVWDEPDIEELMDLHGVDLKNDSPSLRSDLCRQVVTLLQRSKEQLQLFDYDDMVWLPVVLQLTGPRYDVVFIDEGQDLNKVQMLLLERTMSGGGRTVIVADPRQSIYHFRGADTKAVENLKTKFSAQELPLSVCYRCSKAVVAEAKKIVPHIEASETAPDGEVKGVEQDYFLDNVAPGDMVLCRTSAPLVPVYFKLVRKKVKVSIVGRDIGTGLARLVSRFGQESIKELLVNLDEYRKREIQKYMASYKPEKAAHVIDQVETIVELSSEAKTVPELLDVLRSVFSEERVGIALSTVHKAKGLEADRVWILRPDLMPHPLAKTPEAVEQEMNLKYVAVTRAKHSLYFVYAPPDARKTAPKPGLPAE